MLLLYVYARRRVGPYLALLPAIVVLFAGPGWQDILWPFQIAWLISIAAAARSPGPVTRIVVSITTSLR